MIGQKFLYPEQQIYLTKLDQERRSASNTRGDFEGADPLIHNYRPISVFQIAETSDFRQTESYNSQQQKRTTVENHSLAPPQCLHPFVAVAAIETIRKHNFEILSLPDLAPCDCPTLLHLKKYCYIVASLAVTMKVFNPSKDETCMLYKDSVRTALQTVFTSVIKTKLLTFRHRASQYTGQVFRYSPENAFYIFNQQIYFII